MAQTKGRQDGLVAENRRARREYSVEDTIEAGIMLVGSEVKSLREGRANIAESYAAVENGELWLINSYIPEFVQANRFNHLERRPRKLLVNKRELSKLFSAVQRDGITIVPLKLYFNEKGRAKLLIGLGKGKKKADKRETERNRDWARQKSRLLKSYD